MTTVVQDFLAEAPAGTGALLRALAIAESLTDGIVDEIYALAPIANVSSGLFIRALHYADFIVPRNSEWHLVADVRRELLAMQPGGEGLVKAAHELLLARSSQAKAQADRAEVPRYLFTAAGQAYHKAELGITDPALALYAEAASGPLNGPQWLAAKLASEQEARGIIPPNYVQVLFLRGIVLFREGRRREAMPLLEKVARSESPLLEVAIAKHIFGNHIARRQPGEAETMLWRSIEIGREIKERDHEAQVLHSLANVIGRDQHRAKEAEELFWLSFDTRSERDRFGRAQVLHSLANLISRNRAQAKKAEDLYWGSVQIFKDIHNGLGEAQVLHSLANLLSRDRDRSKEAEKRYEESIKLLRDGGDELGEAQALHSLGNLIARNRHRSADAEKLYRRSIEIDHASHNRRGVAQTMHSLANVVRFDPSRQEAAEDLLRESLRIGVELPDLRHQAQVLRSLSFIVEKRSPEEALRLLNESLTLNRRINNRRGMEIVQQSITQLRNRYGL